MIDCCLQRLVIQSRCDRFSTMIEYAEIMVMMMKYFIILIRPASL